MANGFNQKKSLSVMDLRGTLFIIPGIILMLCPFPWDANVALWLDAAGFLLMAVGLFVLHQRGGGFGMAHLTAIGALALTVLQFFAHYGLVGDLLPLVVYCLVLYFMCTSFANLANQLHDHDMAHHFRHHMIVDIIVTLVEVAIHAVNHSLHLNLEILGYIALAVAIYCEAVLMICMWRFYKKYNGYTLHQAA